jgi:phytoene dehydrogenase-like protein
MMIHLALSKSLQWHAGEDLNEFAYVHVAPYLEDLARTYSDSLAGFLPASPFLVVGQTSAVDPSRAPRPANVLWVQVRSLPGEIRGDARDEIQGRSWADAKEAFADRVMDKLEDYAPGATQLILDRVVASPALPPSFMSFPCFVPYVQHRYATTVPSIWRTAGPEH